MIGSARKKPVEIDFVRWTGANVGEVLAFLSGHDCLVDTKVEEIHLITLENSTDGKMIASLGDFIIKGVAGEFYPCKPDIFEKTYDILP